MGSKPGSHEIFTRSYEKATGDGRSATHAGEQRKKEGKGLHELIDPKGNGVIRVSKSRYEPNADGTFYLLRGTAMLEETRLDTTGSMGGNVKVAMRVLPKTFKLLAEGPKAILRRYDVQMITSIFGDVVDDYILCRSQAEIDERIAEQMTYMVPEAGGGDTTEDPQYGLFGAAYLTFSSIKNLGLKSYDFTITDAPTREFVSMRNLERVFGPEVLIKAKENGYELDARNLPSTKEIVQDLLKTTHAFVLLVGESEASHWGNIFGPERVVIIPSVEYLPEVKAAIIGLTEGVLELGTVESFLIEEAGLSSADAARIKRAIAGIPIGAQAMLDNFDKIPLVGDIFEKREDLWPIKPAGEVIPEAASTWK
jgi:hypothetical protein